MMDQLNNSFYTDKKDINMTKYAEKVFAFWGNDDPNIPQKVLKNFAEAIGGNACCVEKAGHFNASAGYLSCYEVLNAIMQCK